MSARALGVIVIVTGGRHHVVSVEDLAFLERILRALGAKEIHTAGSDGVAAQVKAGARTRGIAVRRVTAKWMHDGPANAGERTITLAGVARTVIAFPDEAATVDLLTRARKRRLRIIRKSEPTDGSPADAGSAVPHLAKRTAPAVRNFPLTL